MPVDYHAKSKKATAFVRSHTFVGVGKNDADAMAMWNRLATEAEQTLATPQYDFRLVQQRPLERLQGKDNPATDYPATDYPAADVGLPMPPPNAPILAFFTAAAVYQRVGKKPAAQPAKKSTATSKKRVASPKR